MIDRTKHIDTRCIHDGNHPDPVTGAVIPPVFFSTTYEQETPGVHQGWDYARAGHPTRDRVEETLASLENAGYALTFSTGLAAENAVVQALVPQDGGILCSDDVYGGTGRLFSRVHPGIETKFVDFAKPDVVATHLKQMGSKCSLVWVETPSNPMMKIIDIVGISRLIKAICPEAILLVDNTFSSPIFQQPLKWGADIVLHSATKYLGGHSDLLAGCLMTSSPEIEKKLRFIQFAAGATLSSFDCFLLQRSLKTLAVRLHRHQENALQMADYLVSQTDFVENVYFPGLKTHPGHEIAIKQMSGFSGMISFTVRGGYEKVVQGLQKLKTICLAESLGGVESLINHPARMTHASVPEERRRQLGISDNLLRLSVGIERFEDLRSDLEQAFFS